MIVLGGIMDPAAVSNNLSMMLYVAIGIIIVVSVSLGVMDLFNERFFNRQQERAHSSCYKTSLLLFFIDIPLCCC